MPSDERIAALRAGCEQNIAEGRHPYVGTRIHTLYELLWILKWHGWLGEAEYDYEPQHEYDRGPKVIRANLSGADLHEVDLTGVALVGANLTAVNLKGADLSEANLQNATLTDAHLEDALLSEASLQHANLTRASLTNAELRGANLSDANCTMAAFAGADLRGVSLRHAKVIGVDMQGVNLSGTSLEQVDMRGVNLLGADLHGTSFLHSHLDEVTWPLLGADIVEHLRQEAIDVTTPPERLHDLAWNWPGILFQALVAANPNLDSKTLRELAYLHPAAFLHNPAIPLLLVEQPGWLGKDDASAILIALALHPGKDALDASQRQVVRWLHQCACYPDYPS